MKSQHLKLLQRFLNSPANISAKDIKKAAGLLGWDFRRDGNTFKVSRPGQIGWSFHNPHPGPYVEKGAAKRFVKLCELERAVLTAIVEEGEKTDGKDDEDDSEESEQDIQK